MGKMSKRTVHTKRMTEGKAGRRALRKQAKLKQARDG